MLFLDSRFRIWKHDRNIAIFRHIEYENEVFELENTDKDVACYSVSSIDRPCTISTMKFIKTDIFLLEI